jgi:Glutaredoxin
MSMVLMTASDCHLCERAKEVLAELGVDFREVHAESAEGQQLAASAPPFRPVLYDSEGNLVAYGRLSLKRLRKQLAREEVRT